MKIHFARARPGPTAMTRWRCALVVICMAAGTAFLLQVRSQAVASAPRDASDSLRRSDWLWYFRSGQCRADAHSLDAAIRFLLEPVSDPE